MTDKVLCPWCGREMWHPDRPWERQQPEMGGYMYKMQGKCRHCGALTPEAHGRTPKETVEKYFSAAFRRYEPPCKPMTMEEIKERRERKDANPMWIEWRLSPEKSGWILSKTMNALTIEYNNFLWRCWPRKPTEQEREAYGWGE